MYVSMYVCTYIYIHIYINVYICIYMPAVHERVRQVHAKDMHANIWLYLHTFIRLCTYTHTYMYRYMYTYI